MKSSFKKENEKTKNDIKEWIKSISIAILIAVFIKTFIFNITYVKGESMYPTLEEGDRLILKKYEAVLKTEEYERGDIIVFKSPIENDDRYFIKRVIALQGDRVNIFDGQLHVNDRKVEESYIEKNSFTNPLIYGKDYTVLEDELFVIGDNRLPGKSNDSRGFGPVKLEDIEGKVLLRILPFNKFDANL